MSTTTTPPSAAPTAAPTSGVDPVHLAALAVHAARAAAALDSQVRNGAGAPEVRLAQGEADRAGRRLHQALAIAVPRYQPSDLDPAVKAVAAAAARAARAAR